MIKAVFFDIDGTLVSFKTHKVPQSTIDAIAELRRKGIKVFIATGRGYSQVNNLGDLKFDGYITLNGSCSLTGDLEIIHKNPIPQKDIESLIRYQKGVKAFPCAFVTADEVFVSGWNDEVGEIERLLQINFEPVREITYALDKEILQVVSFFGQDKEEEMMQEVFPNCSSARWNPLFTDVIAKGNSKSLGIDKVLDYYDIDLSESMSFGDGGNDIPMLKHTPISVVMGNAKDEVKQYGTIVTDSVDENGVWNALKKLALI